MSVRASVHACVRWTRGSARVPRSAVARKKMSAGDGATRADKKAGKKYFGGSDGAGEKKKHRFGGSEKKFWRQREHNPQKGSRTVETYWKQLQPLGYFFKSECKREKIFLESEYKKKKNT